MLPLKLTGSLFLKLINQRFDHDHFALRPQHSLLGQHPMVNDDLPHRIITGTIIVKPNVSHFTKTGVVFDDGTQVNDLDVVIFCTGYKIGYKCIDQAVLPVSDNKVELYKYVFPPNLSKPTLAVLGCIQPFGAIFPLAELQARWATQVFRGKKFLPPKDVMMDSIQKKREEMAQRFYASKRHTIQVGALFSLFFKWGPFKKFLFLGVSLQEADKLFTSLATNFQSMIFAVMRAT